jgi:outer membrane protein OmpA-like peptidoglycan-associated protein
VNKAISIIVLLLLSIGSPPVSLHAQGDPAARTRSQSSLAKADRLADVLAFREALPLYLKAVEQDEHPAAVLALASCYRMLQNEPKAQQWYAKVVHIDTIDPLHRLYYGQSLMALERYEEARPWLERYAAEKPDDPRGERLAWACRNADVLRDGGFPAALEALSINSPRTELGPIPFGDRLLFAGERDTILGVQRRNRWSGAPFLALYTAALDEDGMTSGSVRRLKGDLNGRYHDGPAQPVPGSDISGATPTEMYLTRNQEISGARPDDADASVRHLAIARAVLTGKQKWRLDDGVSMPFNGPDFSCAHPALSADGRTLVFSSDRPGGFGGSDLYVSTLKADGSAWTEAVNLGPGINTPGEELFPFLHDDGSLYFSSDGWAGLGGLDLYEASPKAASDGTPRFEDPVHMGAPLNSSRDDFGLYLDATRSSGYMVSNRFGGAGADDVYRVRNVGVRLEGVVSEAYGGKPVSGASIRLRLSDRLMETQQSNREGGYGFQVGAERYYELVVRAPGYLQKRIPVSIGALEHPASVRVDVSLEDTLQIRLLVQVLNLETREPLQHARVMVYNKCTNVNEEFPADSMGLLRLRLDPNCTFYLAGRQRGFIDDNEAISTVGLTESAELGATLELPEIKEDLIIELKNIYYDYGRYYIREDAVEDLDNLVALMEEYPSLKIEISSHTDSRGSDEFNKRLSQKRAETCVDYLVTKGIAQDRLEARGYGEYVPKNRCANGVNCSEEEHQVNRRTEFRVLSFDKVLYSDEIENPTVNQYVKAFGEDKVNRQPGDLVAAGLLDPPTTIILQAPDEAVALDATGAPSSPLLNRQRQASEAAAAAIGFGMEDGRLSRAERERMALLLPEERRVGTGDAVAKEDSILPPPIVPAATQVFDPQNTTTVLQPDARASGERDAPVETPSPKAEPEAPKWQPMPAVKPTPKPAAPPTAEPTLSKSRVDAPAEKAEPSPQEEPIRLDPDAALAGTPAELPWWEDGVSYAVQIAYGTDQTAAYAEYSDLGRLFTETKTNGVPVVLVGRFRKFSEANAAFSEANAAQQAIRSRGIREAFVVSYVDGERLE